MAFHWKNPKDIWKGEGIYHLTFVVTGRKCILGQLGVADLPISGQSGGTNVEVNEAQETVAQFPNTDEKKNTEASVSTPSSIGPNLSDCSANSVEGANNDHVSCEPKLVDAEGHVAVVNLSPFGFAVSNDMKHFEQHHPGMKLVAKMVMPDHVHVVVWVQQNGLQTIRQVGHGIRMGLTHLARQYGVWPQNIADSSSTTAVCKQCDTSIATAGCNQGDTPIAAVGCNQDDTPIAAAGCNQGDTPIATAVCNQGDTPIAAVGCNQGDTSIATAGCNQGDTPIAAVGCNQDNTPKHETQAADRSSVPISGACYASEGESAGSRPGLVFEQPYIRTLSRKGQLRALIEYVHDNAYRRWMKQQHPELFTLHRDTMVAGLRFRSMGNHWLLNWPERQMVECSRSIGTEQLTQLETHCLIRAEQGAVTYSAAISEGERSIVRKIREAGFPVVILLKDGFPPIGSDQECFYKPGGVYFQTCLGGNLLLLEAYDESYESPPIVTATEAQLQLKAQERHQSYRPLPHSSLRWRYMAGNEIVRCLVELE